MYFTEMLLIAVTKNAFYIDSTYSIIDQREIHLIPLPPLPTSVAFRCIHIRIGKMLKVTKNCIIDLSNS